MSLCVFLKVGKQNYIKVKGTQSSNMASSAHVDVSRDKSDESPNMALSPALIRLRNDWLGRSDLLGLGLQILMKETMS